MAAPFSFTIIAIDGGAATGKSSTARGIAERLDLMHVDTGAHYRTITRALLRRGAGPGTPESVEAALRRLDLGTDVHGRHAHITVDGVTPADAELRSPEVNGAVSTFAALDSVRDFLFHYQRSQAAVARAHGFGGLVMEGRDIGSVIFPDAQFRFFLHADESTRSDRRAQEGQTDAVGARDRLDSERKNAPLVRPEGAIEIDTAAHSLEEVIETILALVEGRENAV